MAQAILSDGFVRLCFDPSLNFYEGKPRIFITGPFLTSGSDPATADELILVQSEDNIAAKFGVNSVISSALRKAFATCPNNAQIYAIPRADPGAAVAAEYTLTFTGTSTAAGRISIYFGDDDYAIDVYVPSGSTPTDIATLVLAAMPPEFPWTGVAALGVITFTATNAGTIGNNFIALYNWHGRQNYAPAGVAAATTQTVPGTGVPTGLDLITLLAGCCYTVGIELSEDVVAQTALRDYFRDAWDCDKPQCFGQGYVYNTGTVGEVIAFGDNSPELVRMDYCPGTASLPWTRLAAYGSLSACVTINNPELSIQGREYGVLTAVAEPQTCSICRTYPEEVQLKAAGFVVTGQLNGGSGALTNPYIYNDVTNYLYDDLGRPNVTFRSASSRRLATATAIEIATFLQSFNGLGLFTKTTAIKQGVFGTNPRLMLAGIRSWAKSMIGVLFSEFANIDEDIQLKTDFEVAVPCTGKPEKMHLLMKYRPPVRVGEIDTVLQPEILTNCDR